MKSIYMETAIIILNYKNYSDTIKCVKSILASANSNYHIFVIDNNSQNNSLSKISHELEHFTDIQIWNGYDSFKLSQKVILIQNDENTGYARGNNIGLRISCSLGFKYSLILNNDTLFTDTNLQDFIDTIKLSNNIFCVGPLIVNSEGKIDRNCSRRRPMLLDFFIFSHFGNFLKSEKIKNRYYLINEKQIPETAEKTEITSGACMFLKNEIIEELNYFDENTFLYYEEAILYEKAIAKNYIAYINPKIKLIHSSGKSTSQLSKNTVLARCEYRSLFYYLTNYRKLPRIVAFIVSINQFTFYILKELKDLLLDKKERCT